MIVTDIRSCMHFCVNKWAKYNILFNKFQFIDQTAIKNVRQLLYIKSSRSVKQFPLNIASDMSYCP